MSTQRALSGQGMKLASGDLRGIDKLPSDAIAVFCFADVRPLAGAAGYLDWRISGSLSRALQSKAFAASRGESMLLPVKARARFRRLFVFGLGARAACDAAAYREVCQLAVAVMKRAGVTEIVFAAPAVAREREVEQEFVRAAADCVRNDVALVLVDPEPLA